MVDYEKCTGCSACVSVCERDCIKMEPDRKGFLHPVVERKNCVRCGRCDDICPIEKESTDTSFISSYAAINRNDSLRRESTSGGVFPFLAEYVIDNGGMVCGAIYDCDCAVQHIITEDKNRIKRMQGAKYSQSDLNSSFRKIKTLLKEDKLVLFVGTPCQVAGLLSYVGDRRETLIAVDMVCHGVASPFVWRDYLQERRKEDARGSQVLSVNLRDKSTGWSRYSYSVHIEYENGKRYRRKQYDDAFLKGYINNLFLRSSCEACRYKGIKREADLTLGDCWGVWDHEPEMDDNGGTSLLLAHSEKGKRLLDVMRNTFIIKRIDIVPLMKENKSMTECAIIPDESQKFWDYYFQNGKVNGYLYTLFPACKITARERFGEWRRNALGHLRKKNNMESKH